MLNQQKYRSGAQCSEGEGPAAAEEEEGREEVEITI